MGLNFDIAWELTAPPDGSYINSKIPSEAVERFFLILARSANRTTDAEEVFFIIRSEFNEATGVPVYRSSSMKFAPGDAKEAMDRAAENAPIFISAFYGTCQKIEEQFGSKAAPSVTVMNRLLEMHRIGYVIDPPSLLLREQVEVVPVPSTKVLEQAQARFRESIERSRVLLEEDKGDEAVSQIWWLLESIVLSFVGSTLNGQEITGTYFNEVAKALKRAAGDGSAMGTVARWLEALQSYLSGQGKRAFDMDGICIWKD